MKKLLFIMLFLLSVQFLFCQVLKGKWVIPTIEEGTHKTFELSFMSDGSIISDELPVSAPNGSFCEISSGGYLSNFDLQFYFLGSRFCYGDQYFPWNNMGSQTVSYFDPEFQIINKPGSYNRYYAFYTGTDYDADDNNDKFCFTEVYFEDNDSNDKIFIFSDGDAYAFDLNKGRIGGIEFSDYNPDYLYVSCPADGLIAINFQTGDVVQQLNTSSDYGHTYLQKAPDGHIYGVSNSGHFLGRINQTTGEFEPDVFEMPSLGNGNIVSAFRVFEEQKYFILPEDSREYNPFTVEIEPTHVSCPGLVDGSAEAIVTGGQPDFTYQWYSWDGNDYILMQGYIGPIAENLSVGLYKCCVTDANEDIVCQEIDITVDPLLFSHPGQFWVINATPSEPVTANYEFELGIMVTNNSTLTLNNCYFQFGKYARVIVEQGSTLILNNTVFTNLEECGDTWQGVEVWGNRFASQATLPGNPCAQGKLILQNYAKIENAILAVDLMKPGDLNMTGGIIQARNATFLNNTRSVHAQYYRNFNPLNTNEEWDNWSWFDDCSFTLDNQYLGAETFYKHVDLDQVKGIKFKGCSFSLAHDASNISQWNVGIAAYNAGFSVLPRCMTPTIPCAAYDSCSFSGFNWAIGIWDVTQAIDPPVYIGYSHFYDNSTGIYLNGNANAAILLNNYIEVGYDAPYHGNCDFADGVGIDMQQSSGFAVENNILWKNAQAPTDGHYAGIRVLDCPSDHDIIYKNEFHWLYYGNYAQGTNRSNSAWDFTGVDYQCNYNSHNAVDFIVIDENPTLAMIRGYLGSQDTAAGNVFSRYEKDVWHFKNEGTNEINYYYCSSISCTDEEPINIHTYHDIPELFEKIVSSENGCADHYGGGGHIELSAGERQEKEMTFAQSLSDYNSVRSLYESLIDGGNTETELSDIQSAEPEDMWELRSQLLGDSPHLSQEVLRAVSDRTDVFPDGVLLEILSANPDELNRDTLLSYLEQKENPLPDYMISILRQSINGVTYKTILENDMAGYFEAKTQAAQDIIRSILYDSVFNITDYRNWLDNMNNIVADRQIIASYLSENDTSSAFALLNLLPSLYDLQGEDLEDYNDYKTLVNLQVSWKYEGNMMNQPDSSEISILESIASNTHSYAGNMARNILTYANIHHYCNCLPPEDSAYLKNEFIHTENIHPENNILKISAEPNPAHTFVSFNFELPDDNSSGQINVSDISGKVIWQIQVNGKRGQKVWNCSSEKAGVYNYNLMSSGLYKAGKVVIY